MLWPRASAGLRASRRNPFGPLKRDSDYVLEHPSGLILWLRAVKPTVEAQAERAILLLRNSYNYTFGRVVKRFSRYTREEKAAALGAGLGILYSFLWWAERDHQRWVDARMDKMADLCEKLEAQGFFDTKEQYNAKKIALYVKHKDRLNKLWEKAYVEAMREDTAEAGFMKLAEYLKPTEEEIDQLEKDYLNQISCKS